MQKSAFGVLGRTVVSWGMNPVVAAGTSSFLTEIAQYNGQQSKKNANGNSSGSNGSITPTGSQIIPGYERFIYDSIIPAGFNLIMDKNFRPTDGQSLMVSSKLLTNSSVSEKAFTDL